MPYPGSAGENIIISLSQKSEVKMRDIPPSYCKADNTADDALETTRLVST